MIRTTLTIEWIAVFGFANLGVQFGHALQCSIEVLHFKPEQDSIAIRLFRRIANRTVIMLDVPVMQLHHQLPVMREPFILFAAVVALHTQ